MSEVQGLAELGLLPNPLKHTQPASADSISIKATTPTAQHGNLTGPTSYAAELWCEDAQQPPGQGAEEGFTLGHLCAPLSVVQPIHGQLLLSAQILPLSYCQQPLLRTRQIKRENGALSTPVAWSSSPWRRQVSCLYLTGS